MKVETDFRKICDNAFAPRLQMASRTRPSNPPHWSWSPSSRACCRKCFWADVSPARGVATGGAQEEVEDRAAQQKSRRLSTRFLTSSGTRSRGGVGAKARLTSSHAAR